MVEGGNMHYKKEELSGEYFRGNISEGICPGVMYACPKELEAASRSSKTHLAKNGGGRSAPI